MRYHYLCVRVAKAQNTDNFGEDEEQKWFSFIASGMQNGAVIGS